MADSSAGGPPSDPHGLRSDGSTPPDTAVAGLPAPPQTGVPGGTPTGARPGLKQRVEAIVALVSIVVLVEVVVAALWDTPEWLALGLVGLGLAGWGGWWLATEQMPRRAVGIAALVLGLAAVMVAIPGVIIGADRRVWSILLIVALTTAAVSQARLALVRELHRRDRPTAPRPQRPVLFVNPESGDGKVDRFAVVPAARKLGVQTVVLQPGDDLGRLAREAVDRGADCLGMAGGDGSQAVVASVAAEHDLPFVCIPAGTRNHFAQDLDLDRDDPRAALAAFVDAVERRVDVASVGDRAFVNNVSLGAYATIVQDRDYRAAKLETSLDLLPEVLGQQKGPFDLRFTTPDGEKVDGAFLVLVSNNPYVLGPRLDLAQRRSLTTGRLGVFAVTAATGPQAASLAVRAALGLGASDPCLHQFEVERFEVRSRSGSLLAGIDGEAAELPAPLQFRIHPRGLRVRVPHDNQERMHRRRARNVSIRDLVRVALGRPLA